jgi:hypothetical protein
MTWSDALTIVRGLAKGDYDDQTLPELDAVGARLDELAAIATVDGDPEVGEAIEHLERATAIEVYATTVRNLVADEQIDRGPHV